MNNEEYETVVYEEPGEISRVKAGSLSLFVQDYFKNPEVNDRFEAWLAKQQSKQQETQSA